jgi:rhodanese-related sulfurtransferase
MPVSEISPEALAEKLAGPKEKRPVLVDVRSPEEHEHVRIPGSLLMPLNELGTRDDEVAALEGKDVVVYCHHGIRSRQGAAYFQSKGIEAKSLAGGIDLFSIRVNPALPRY